MLPDTPKLANMPEVPDVPDTDPNAHPNDAPKPDLDLVDTVDIVDEHDVVVRTVPRAEMRRDRLRHRGVFIAVFTTDNRLVIHQRSPDKDVWPSRWDLGAGGVVDAGEFYETAARRELAEELGLDGPDITLSELGRGYYEDSDVALFARGFACIHDGPYRFTDGEVVALEQTTLANLETILPQRAWCPDSIAFALPLIRQYLDPLSAQ
jgi:8-oxo-dGTP pyrophosphatase MutT (NUDIX family)